MLHPKKFYQEIQKYCIDALHTMQFTLKEILILLKNVLKSVFFSIREYHASKGF
jgi:hypothetical protein